MDLPRSYARRLASASHPVIITDTKKKGDEGELFGWLADRAWLGALFVASIVGVLLIGSVSSAATHGHHVVARAPKTLAVARSADRHVGHHTPSVKPARPLKPAAHVHRSHRR